MNCWYEWLFDGIGTEVVSIIAGIILGGIGGFFIGRYTKSKQIQKAKDGAKQKQTIAINDDSSFEQKNAKRKIISVQKQKAGNNSEQVQMGSVNNGRR